MSYSSPKWSTDAAFIAYTDMVAKDANAIYIVARTAGRFDDSKASVSMARERELERALHLWMKSLFDQDDWCLLVESCHDAV